MFAEKTAPKKRSPTPPKDSNGKTIAQSPNNKSQDGATAEEAVTNLNQNQPESNQNHLAKKSSTNNGDYLLHIALTGTYDPMIVRILYVPSDLTFDKLHQVIQIAFGSAGIHAHSFDIRSTEGPIGFMGGKLLLTLNPSTDYAGVYPDPENIKLESEYTLADIFDADQYKGKVDISYEYDHGDSWNHSVVLLGRADTSLKKVFQIEDEIKILCIGGEGHACAEDAGGLDGWEDLKEVFKPRKRDPDGKKEWYKTICANGDPKGLDAWKWDMLDVNDGLMELNGEWYGSSFSEEKEKILKKQGKSAAKKGKKYIIGVEC